MYLLFVLLLQIFFLKRVCAQFVRREVSPLETQIVIKVFPKRNMGTVIVILAKILVVSLVNDPE